MAGAGLQRPRGGGGRDDGRGEPWSRAVAEMDAYSHVAGAQHGEQRRDRGNSHHLQEELTAPAHLRATGVCSDRSPAPALAAARRRCIACHFGVARGRAVSRFRARGWVRRETEGNGTVEVAGSNRSRRPVAVTAFVGSHTGTTWRSGG